MRVSIVGGSGYTGGELVRILLNHPEVELGEITSRSFAGRSLWKAHPNLRNVQHRFSEYSADRVGESDVVFTCLPHTASMGIVPELVENTRVVDLGADFRLRSAEVYREWYGVEHTAPELLENAVYGIPELHGDEMRNANLVAGAGCEATSSILALAPLRGNLQSVIVDAKIGGCAAGRTANAGTHYPERANAVRPYAPEKHRHAAEIEQEVGVSVEMTAHAVGMVRGILTTNHVLGYEEGELNETLKAYRDFYNDSPFVRVTPTAVNNLPNPKYVLGSNYCDVGLAQSGNRLVVFSALDNMMKGASGQAVQCMNIMFGFEETQGLEALPIYPI
ncbi:MAG: N-acetyl-gamma-glutamyl-phosphate reductase [archaeon]